MARHQYHYGILQSTCSVRVAKLPSRALCPALVVAEVVMLCQIFEREGFAIFTEAQQLVEESHVNVDIVPDVLVKPRWCGRTVDCVLDIAVLPIHISQNRVEYQL